mgnify:CR=1 FL=1
MSLQNSCFTSVLMAMSTAITFLCFMMKSLPKHWTAKKIGGNSTAHIFDREGKVIILGSSINKASINRDVNPKMPYLSFLAINYDIPAINDAQKLV